MQFLRETEQTADQLLAGYGQPIGRPDVKTQEAMDIIREMLKDGEEHEAAECKARLFFAGVSPSTAKRAKRLLGVRSSKPHFTWYWQLDIDRK